MHKLTFLALAAGLATASCSGGHGLGSMPPVSAGGETQTARTAEGADTVRTATAVAKAPPGWAATATQGIKLASATDLGPLATTKSITVRLGLQMRNGAQLRSFIASGGVMSPGTFQSSYAPTPAQAAAVTQYLRTERFTGITVDPNNMLVSATGSAAVVSKAFDTTIHAFTQNGKSVYANTTPAYVPASLSGTVLAVLGLNDASLMAVRPKAQPTACNVEGVGTPSAECLRFYDPATFQIAYLANGADPARSTPIAIMAEGDVSGAISNLRLNETQFKLPQVPVTVVHVGLASPDTSGDDEWTLDMTYSSGIAQTVPALYVYDATSLTDSDIAFEYNRWVTDRKTVVGNSSFGECEAFPWLDGAMVVDDQILAQAAAEGMTMFASTGDSGGFCGVTGAANGVPGGAPLVEYPAASPYVVGVGGTDLFTNADGSYKGETAWEAGGGGLSQFETAPAWQSGIQPANASGDRGLPDIAMDAALETGALLWGGAATNGSCTPCVTGGTSLASPLAAGSWARIQTEHGNRLGFAAPIFYKNYAASTASSPIVGPPATRRTGGFHDILSGSNGDYSALPGYDYASGLGSLDIAPLEAEIGK